MRAIVYAGPGVVALREAPEPVLQAPHDALVRVSLAGLCGTDLHVISGEFPGLEPGAIIGHEFVGDIIAVGSAVIRLKIGDHVMASDFTACGFCRWCGRGEHWQCAERSFFGTGSSFGPALAGAQAEIVRVPHAETTLAKVPQGCSDEAALLIGDNLATGWTAIERASVSAGDTVAIIGGGAVGQLTSLAAQVAGASVVIVIEPNAERRQFARTNGALAATPQDASRLIAGITDGDGVDVVIEAVGAGAPLHSAFDLVRKRGRIVAVGAHSTAEWAFPLALGFAHELQIGFAIGNSIRARPRLSALVGAGLLDPTVVIDARLGFNDVAGAYRDLREQKIMKAVIEPRR
ncbi:MAG: alcohol dehydrogenase catalytic domain-containing protein [Gammaproteobacteria bacterium]